MTLPGGWSLKAASVRDSTRDGCWLSYISRALPALIRPHRPLKAGMPVNLTMPCIAAGLVSILTAMCRGWSRL